MSTAEKTPPREERTLRIYRGARTRSGCSVTVESADRQGQLHVRPLPLQLHLWNRSPTGFEWGHRGAGTAHLALAILADHLGDDSRARLLHQAFKQRVVAGLANSAWTLTAEDVQAAVDEIGAPAGL